MATTTWNIDAAHSGVHFTVRHMVISKVRGAFDRFEGAIQYDPDDAAASSVTVKIEAASVDTREAKRDEHLRSPDFFDVQKFPLLTFQSKRVIKGTGDRFRVVGDLTIRGVTREVELESELLGKGKDPWGNERIAFTGKTTIQRKDFGLTWNQALEAGGVLVGDAVEISLDVQAVKAKVAEKAA